MKESRLTQEEYDENRPEIEKLIRLIKTTAVLEAITNNKTSNIAAKRANVTVDEIYEWYFKGRNGDEDYKKFYELFHKAYVRPNINSIQDKVDYRNQNVDTLVKVNKDKVTKNDVEIWVKHGLLENNTINLDKNDDDDEDDSKPKYNRKEMLKEMGVKGYDKISIKKAVKTSSILNNDDVDIEMLKKQIMKK